MKQVEPSNPASPPGPPPPVDAEPCPRCHTPLAGRMFCPVDGTLRAPGQVVGERYELVRSIGAGGMGFVFEARHTLLGKKVALKVLKSELSLETTQVTRFLREAQLCSQITHENIVDITDFGRDASGQLYLVMELLTGTTLADQLDRGGPLPTRAALLVLRQLCRALDSAHKAGVVHRDLNPKNVFLTTLSGRANVVKLLDFGISRMAGGGDRVTSTGIGIGTTAYMPPEQLRGAAQQDHRVDIYALGVIAYQILTGQLPFRAETPAELIAEKLENRPISLRRSALSSSAPAIEQLVAECLASDPERRPASAGEVEQRLFSSGDLSSDQPEDLGGVRAGSYRLVSEIGAGGLGTVWIGEHPVIGSRVAVKILHPEMCENEEAVRRFVVEAQAVNRINSPHIVRTFDFGKLPDGRDYAVMELLEGETLAERLGREGRLSWPDFLHVARQLTEGMRAAHEAGIVHRDLKPENLHLGGEAQRPLLKILDFGIAKLLGAETAEAHKTQLGTLMGTPIYAAPEQMSSQSIGKEADLYALGAVFYELLAGHAPFEGNVQEVIAAKLTRIPTPLSEVRRELSPALVALVQRMLAVDPAQRPDIGEVAMALEASAGAVDAPALAAEASSPAIASSWPSNPGAAAVGSTRATPAAGSAGSQTLYYGERTAGRDVPTAPEAELNLEAPGEALQAASTDVSSLGLAGTRSRALVLVGCVLGGIAVAVVVIWLLATNRGVGEAERHETAQPATPTGAVAKGPSVEPLPVAGPAEAKQKTSEADVRSTTKVRLIKVSSTPAQADVWLGERKLGSTPLSVKLDPRLTALKLTVARQGFASRQVTLSAETPDDLMVKLVQRRRERSDPGWQDPFTPRHKRSGVAKPEPAAKQAPAAVAPERPRPPTPTRPKGLVNPFED